MNLHSDYVFALLGRLCYALSASHLSLRIVIATTFNSSPGHPIDIAHQRFQLLGFLGFLSCIELILYLCRRKFCYFTPSQVLFPTTLSRSKPSYFAIKYLLYYKLVLHNDCQTA
jgi:hypothetical protein